MRLINRRRGLMGGVSEVIPPPYTYSVLDEHRMEYSNGVIYESSDNEFCVVTITLATAIIMSSVTFSAGKETTARCILLDENGNRINVPACTPIPRTFSPNSTPIKTIRMSVYKSDKLYTYFINDDTGEYIFNGSTFDWASYGIT